MQTKYNNENVNIFSTTLRSKVNFVLLRNELEELMVLSLFKYITHLKFNIKFKRIVN